MKQDVHPTYYPATVVTCACGNTFTVGSTMPEIKTELCSKCHPFYTGTQKLVDTAHRVDDFKKRLAKSAATTRQHVSKTAKHTAKKQRQTKKAA
ncbi:MAG: 50S ribosomal protein L31 [Patescibacteria group bacterium]